MTTSWTLPLRRAVATLAGLAVATAGLTVAGAPSGAADVSERRAAAKVTTTINLQGGAKEKLGGKVKSRRVACKRNRTVSLHFKQPGRNRFRVVRTDKTTRAGVWVVPAPGADIPPGRYFARVGKKGVTCKASTSRTITVR